MSEIVRRPAANRDIHGILAEEFGIEEDVGEDGPPSAEAPASAP